jgi:DNA-directed RNA polymerase specialized sigma24 family protein
MRSDAGEQAYVEFVTARQTHLRRVAFAICGDWHRADDLLQHALTRLYVGWPRIQREGAEEEFVRRVIVRARLDPAPGRSQARDDTTPLFGALQALPLRQRKVAVLHHWLGLSLEETAHELGTSTAAVRTLAERSLAELSGGLPQETR